MPAPQGTDTALPQSHEKRFRVNHDNALGDYFLSPDFIRPYGPDAWKWFPPTTARPPMAPGELRAALLNAATYLDAGLDAQIEGDDEAVRHNLEVVRGIVAVVLGQLPGASAEHSVTLQ